jgi:hypothetical protein
VWRRPPSTCWGPPSYCSNSFVCNDAATAELVPDDDLFLSHAFDSKRLNGWGSFLGDADLPETQFALHSRWQLQFIGAGTGLAGLYYPVNMLARSVFVYGRVPLGDSHLLGHFIEDFTSGLLVYQGRLRPLDLVLSLAAMRIEVPAITPPDYPFRLGRQVRAGSLSEIVEAVTEFSSIRRLLEHPDIPPLPDYLDAPASEADFEDAATWGDTRESFYLLQKGPVDGCSVEVIGSPSGPMGVLLTAEVEPMDGFDRRYIEARAALILARMPGVSAQRSSGRLTLRLRTTAGLPPARIGECLIAAIRNEFPRISKVRAQIIFDRDRRQAMSAGLITARLGLEIGIYG